MTLGHCYTAGDQAATWSKIANEGGASKRKKVHWQEGFEEQAGNVFLSPTATRASQVFEDSWFDQKNAQTILQEFLCMLLSSVDFNCLVITANRWWKRGGGEKGLYLSQEVV
jgi:hypothetical protein